MLLKKLTVLVDRYRNEDSSIYALFIITMGDNLINSQFRASLIEKLIARYYKPIVRFVVHGK